MNLADILSFTDIQQLGSIARHYECDCSLNSKRELIQAILTTINKREVHEQVIASSSIEELRFLNSLLFERRNSFSIEELVARAELMNFTNTNDEAWNPRDVISKFKQRGWLFNGYCAKTKYLFQVPQDLKTLFSRILTHQFQLTIEEAPEPLVYRDEQSLIQDDINVFLQFISKHRIALTTDGYMYKKYLLKLLELLAVREDIVQKEAWRFGYGRRFKAYPNRFSVIYDYCYQHGYIIEEHGILSLTNKGQDHIKTNHKDDIISIYRYWLQLYGKPIKNLSSFVYWICQLARQWITVTSLQHTLCHYIKPFYYDTSDMVLEKRILQMMMHQGLLRIGHHESMGYVTQMTDLGIRVIQETSVMEA